MLMHPQPRRRRRAASLVVTLLCITVLTIIVVAFLQSMTLERKTAQSYSSITRAQLAAESAQNEAVTRLGGLMAALPYHAIGYTNVGSGTNAQLYTILYGATNASSTPTTYFLCSTTNTSTNLGALSTIPAGLTPTNSTAVNRRTGDGSTNDPGWMGSPVSTNGALLYREARAPWVYILQDPSRPHQPNRAAANYNPRVARYAWWIEDETSKIDITVAGNNQGTSGAFRPAQSTNIVSTTNTFRDAQIIHPSLMDAGALPLLNGLPIATNNAAANNQLITFRTNAANLPRDGRFLAQAPGFATSEAKARYYTTMAGIANDLAGNGMRRVNLNAIVTEGVSSTNTIASDLDDIAFAITGKHLFPGLDNDADEGHFHNLPNATNSALLPEFGARFFTDPLPPGMTEATKRDIYLTKVAANIRDYIDSDSMPTFVDKDGKVFAGQPPPLPTDTAAFPTYLRNDQTPMPRAIGQEAIPYLHKHLYTVTVNSFSGGTANFYLDQHLGFYNPSTKDFVAPAGTVLRVYDRLRWNVSTGLGTRQAGAFEFLLSGFRFAAGRTTIVSTAPAGSGRDKGVLGGYVIRPSYRPVPPAVALPNFEEGITYFPNVQSANSSKLEVNDRTGQNQDTWTRMVWGNGDGYYGGFANITVTSINYMAIGSGLPNPSTFYTSLCGNDANSRSGDARSLMEALRLYDSYASGNTSGIGEKDQARFYYSSDVDMADASNTFIDPTKAAGQSGAWGDYTLALDDNIRTAYSVIRDQPMTSIGELGHIYDPHRKIAEGGATRRIEYARGGGRTLKIGQPDDVAGGVGAARFSPTWRNSAWRLTDVFDVMFTGSGTVDATNPTVPAQSIGKININSVLRDDGYALKALLRNFVFLPDHHSDRNLAGVVLRDLDVTSSPSGLVPQIKSYLTTKGPFMERGELSQLPYFSTGSINGRAMSTTMDRGREELFRRIVPMITTRSSSFSIYAIGQAVREDNSGNISPLAEALEGNVYRLDPVFDNSLRDPAKTFNYHILYERF